MPMPTDIVTRGATIAEQGKEYGWSPSRGYFTRRQWSGTRSEIEALEPQLYAFGYEYVVQEGPVWKVIATIGQDASDGDPGGETEIPIPQFELFSDKREVDLLESDSPICTSLRPELIKDVSDSVNLGAPNFLTGSKYTQNEKNAAMDLYIHYVAGAKSFVTNVPVLRKSYSISNNYTVAANTLYGANFIWKTETIVSQESVPAAIQGLLPPSSTFTQYTATSGITMLAGWLKGYPTYNQIATNRFQVTLDYIYGIWPAKVYGYNGTFVA